MLKTSFCFRKKSLNKLLISIKKIEGKLKLDSKYAKFVVLSFLNKIILIGAVNLINLNLTANSGGVVVRKLQMPQGVESKNIKFNRKKKTTLIASKKKIFTTQNVFVVSNLATQQRTVQKTLTSKHTSMPS